MFDRYEISSVVYLSPEDKAFFDAVILSLAHRLTEQRRNQLSDGLSRLENRGYCNSCPMPLMCAAAEIHAEKRVPELHKESSPFKRKTILETLASLGIKSIEPESSLCLSSINRAIDKGYLFEASPEQTQSDPITPNHPTWLVDRVFNFVDNSLDRVQAGQRR